MTRPLHILIIDDDPDDAGFLMEAFLNRLPGTRFSTVETGDAAVSFLLDNGRQDAPDVAFLDLHMPGKDGYQVLLELRNGEQIVNLPIMVISTSILPSEAERCRQAGCTGYFIKPVSMDGYEAIVTATTDHLKMPLNDVLSRMA